MEDALFFVLTDGDKCACGKSQSFLDKEKTPDTCESPCSGDDSFTCGGPEEYEIYELFDDIPVETPAPVDEPEPTDEPAAPAPAVTPAPVDETPGPGPAEPGPDIDGDGNLDRWEYDGCYDNPSEEIIDFDDEPEDDDLTPIVSTLRSYPSRLLVDVESLWSSPTVRVCLKIRDPVC